MDQESLFTDISAAKKTLLSDPTGAQMLAEKAILWASRNGWVSVLAHANLLAGDASRVQYIAEPAIAHYQRANTLFKDLSEYELAAESYFGLGSVYLVMGEYSLAIENLRKSMSWLQRSEQKNVLNGKIRLQLSRALMNLGYWSDAEQELLQVEDLVNLPDTELADYQIQVLRLAFYRGDKRTVTEQLALCRELIVNLEPSSLHIVLEYYSARFIVKYERVKTGEAELLRLWEKMERVDKRQFFLAYEAALDLLQSDYPNRGIHWLSILLDDEGTPLELQRQIHQSLAHFFVAHLSHELATEHFMAAEKVASQIRESEVNLQWVRYRADEAQEALRNQVAQHKKNNKILAESNALLQAVNRIAMTVNASLDMDNLVKRLREHLAGWIDAEYIAIAEYKDDSLNFRSLFEGDRRLPDYSVPMTEDRAWSVRSVKEGRIHYDNDFVMKEDTLVDDSPNLVRSVSFTPLKCENKVIGLLTLQSRKAQVFESRSISLLEYIAPVVGIAFANILNLERTRELSGRLSKQEQELHDVRQLMAHLADHDELTGLPYRTSLPEHFEQWVLKAPFQCLAIRLTNLQSISQNLGFGRDDDVVKIVAQRLRNRVRPDDLLVRMSDDQFILFVEQLKTRDHLLEFSGQLLQLIEQPLRAKDQTVGVEGAIGVVSYPAHGESLEEIISMIAVAVSHAVEDETSIFCIE